LANGTWLTNISFGSVVLVESVVELGLESLGEAVGMSVGPLVGGELAGLLVGEEVGLIVGEAVGLLVGESVGLLVVRFVELFVVVAVETRVRPVRVLVAVVVGELARELVGGELLRLPLLLGLCTEVMDEALFSVSDGRTKMV
jgi:hypothetical protein